MIPWEQRPVEIANLLNPAFCGQVIRLCIGAYAQEAAKPFPYPLTFLVLPIVLHSQTRERLGTRQRQLHTWLQDNEDLKIGFAERTRQLIPISTEAITFLLQIKTISVNQQAGLEVFPARQKVPSQQDQTEIANCYRKAGVIGRLFARAGTPSTIYALWGVTL